MPQNQPDHFPLFAYITQRNINLMLIGITTALVLISAILLLLEKLETWTN